MTKEMRTEGVSPTTDRNHREADQGAPNRRRTRPQESAQRLAAVAGGVYVGAHPHRLPGFDVYWTAVALERLLADMGVEEHTAIDERTLFAHDFPPIGILPTSGIRTGDRDGEAEVARSSGGADFDDVGEGSSPSSSGSTDALGVPVSDPHEQVMRSNDHNTARNRAGVAGLWLWCMSKNQRYESGGGGSRQRGTRARTRSNRNAGGGRGHG